MSAADTPVQIGMEPELLNKKAAAKVLGEISVRELDRYVRRGLINPQMLGGRVMFTPTELRRFVADECTPWEPK